MKIAFALLFFMISLFARENPFFPVDNQQELPFTSNLNEELEPLKRASISLPPQARVLQKITVSFKNLDGSIENKSIDLNHQIDWHLPLFISQSYQEQELVAPKNTQEYRYLGAIPFAKFYVNKRHFKILSKDVKLRDFMLVDPHRIVIDFKRDAGFKTQTIFNKDTLFKKIRIGNHSSYYRIVIELDGTYKYKSQKIKDGYLFEVY